MICEYCKKEFEPNTPKQRFCSSRCRVSLHRKGSIVTQMTAEELYDVINQYENDEWVDSPEFIELKGRVDKMSVKELKEGGYFIPCRKFPHPELVS